MEITYKLSCFCVPNSGQEWLDKRELHFPQYGQRRFYTTYLTYLTLRSGKGKRFPEPLESFQSMLPFVNAGWSSSKNWMKASTAASEPASVPFTPSALDGEGRYCLELRR